MQQLSRSRSPARCGVALASLFLAAVAASAGAQDGPPVISGASTRPATEPTTNEAPTAAALVSALASKDVAEQSRAARELETMGPRARPALLRGVNGADPLVRMAAGPLLLRLPFERPEDPAEVRGILRSYGNGDVAARKAAVVKLTVQAPAAVPALLFRLIREDPSEEVRWSILGQIRRLGVVATAQTAGAAPQDIPRAPNLALAGLAVGRGDPNLSVALLERAVELEGHRPTAEPEVLLTYLDLATLYTQRRRFDDAADLHRRGYVRNPAARFGRPGEPGVVDHLQLLFTLHAQVGPLRGFADDLVTFGHDLARPHLLYAVGRVYERRGQPFVAQALYRAAGLLVPAAPPAARDDVARYAMSLGILAPAEQMFEDVLASAGGDAAKTPEAINARLQLALIAAQRGQDFLAAERLRKLVEGGLPASARITWRGLSGAAAKVERGDTARLELEAQMHWRYLRAARAKKDANSIKAHLKELLRLRPASPEIAMDAVPLLLELNRPDDAARLFEAPYAAEKSALDARPDDPLRMNQLAWLCARCGQRLDEAQRLVAAALARDEDNPAFLDTAAEIQFRLGHNDEAIRLETRALELRPNDPFMTRQLDRFRNNEGRQ
jgi:tetratricopeptide (TPR) repeat protein